MSDEGLNSLVYSKNVIELITVANEFCSFLERADEMESADFLSRLQKMLPLLYLKASLLPKFEFEADDDLEKYVTEVEYNLIQQKILAHTGAGDDYQEVFIPGMQFSESALTSSIAENVADVYQDMKDLIMSFRTMNDEVMEQALWESQSNFAQVWGQKLVNCLRAVHNLIYSENNTDEDSLQEGNPNNELKNKNPDWLNDRFSFQGE
ncbi:hypothetical protein AQPE_0982 [Aquipluma nitroreducens]|uniref:DUF5063 domain-containing protein n=1 Tax=Aquipluma nitroreducens TaxID=2010828 RepID=A0A5K7S5S4_9BACT|nr:DUF5063 domain-containing protein [Aquipluma nitroreducens]BBE16835.1 hypothetical protein AQPE_0982 [Aquipluma nitroreducens]